MLGAALHSVALHGKARKGRARVRHYWHPHPDSESIKRPFQRVRVCQNCGAEQTYETMYEWMRVVGYCWRPLVGQRCKPKKITNT